MAQQLGRNKVIAVDAQIHAQKEQQVTTAALNYRANGPVVDALLREVGLVEGEDQGLADLVKGNSPIMQQAVGKWACNRDEPKA